MEILGLAVIVIIVVIAIVYTMSQQSQVQVDSKQDVLYTKTAQAFITTLLNTKTQCGPDYRALIKNCFLTDNACGGSCKYVETEAKKILDKQYVNQLYRFTASDGTNKKINLVSQGCEESTGAGIAVIPLFPSSILVDLAICKQ